MKKLLSVFATLFLGFAQMQAQNPYAALGIEEQVLHYDDTHKEVFDNDTLKPIGYGLYSPEFGLLSIYDLQDSLVAIQKIDPSKVARWLSIDPKAREFPEWSPYNYTLDNPVLFIDPDGQAPEWVPTVGSDGKIVLQAEANDNLQTLQTYLKGSKWETQSSQIWSSRTHKEGTHVTLPEDNYSRAFTYAQQNQGDFSDKQQPNDPQNYNCYHFAINGVWEKEIYSFWSSYGDYNMEPEVAQQVLNDYFKPVSSDKAIFGETLVGANYSGGFPQHLMVFGGKDNSGNTYVLHKYGMSEPPTIIKMSDAGTGKYNDQKFFNEKGSQ